MSFEDCIDVVRDWVITQAYATIAYVDAEIVALKAWVEAKAYATMAWVQAQGYATEQWVSKWFSTVVITGTLNPDITGTYLKGGCYGIQPYYFRLDGAYFIWWDGSDRWKINTTLAAPGLSLWVRVDPSPFGNYTPVLPSTGIATLSPDLCYVKPAFVDRGDAPAVDFAFGVLTHDNAWHTLDLSGIVPEGAKGVCISASLVNTGVFTNMLLKTLGNVGTFNVSFLSILVANSFHGADCTVPLDADQKIEYKFTAGGWVVTNLTVKNWWY